MEYFKDIPGYEGIYKISNYGRVASERSFKILKPIRSKRFGYSFVSLCCSGKIKIHKIHRLVLMTFRGASKLHVNHIDFDRSNNCLSNLEYTTAKENTRHAIKAGRHPSKNRRLSANQVREIRESKEMPKILSGKYKIPPSAIYKIRKREIYSDVE